MRKIEIDIKNRYNFGFENTTNGEMRLWPNENVSRMNPHSRPIPDGTVAESKEQLALQAFGAGSGRGRELGRECKVPKGRGLDTAAGGRRSV